MTYYRCSNGQYYDEEDVWERLEAGVWRPCCWDTETGTEWMEVHGRSLVCLEPVDAETVPPEGLADAADREFFDRERNA